MFPLDLLFGVVVEAGYFSRQQQRRASALEARVFVLQALPRGLSAMSEDVSLI